MKTSRLIPLFLLFMTAGIGWAATTYRYECPKCHRVEEFSKPAVRKCPQDGWFMIPKIP
jgi:hypothetical protein